MTDVVGWIAAGFVGVVGIVGLFLAAKENP